MLITTVMTMLACQGSSPTEPDVVYDGPPRLGATSTTPYRPPETYQPPPADEGPDCASIPVVPPAPVYTVSVTSTTQTVRIKGPPDWTECWNGKWIYYELRQAYVPEVYIEPTRWSDPIRMGWKYDDIDGSTRLTWPSLSPAALAFQIRLFYDWSEVGHWTSTHWIIPGGKLSWQTR